VIWWDGEGFCVEFFLIEEIFLEFEKFFCKTISLKNGQSSSKSKEVRGNVFNSTFEGSSQSLAFWALK